MRVDGSRYLRAFTGWELAVKYKRDNFKLEDEVERNTSKKAMPLATRLSFLALGFVAASLIVGIFLIYREATTWDPLGDYPVQVASTDYKAQLGGATYNPRGGIAYTQVLYLDQTLTSVAQKCVKPGEGQVMVKGILRWVSDEPPGYIIDVAKGGGPRGPGCVNYSFQNEVPKSVLKEIKAMTQKGIMKSRWHIFIEETPIKADGTTGEPRSTISTTFVVMHMNKPADAIPVKG